MAFVFNPFTGSLDEVKIPVIDNSAPPTMTGNGDLQTAVIGGKGRIYLESNNQRYYIEGMGDSLHAPMGQPIPIGMGLTMTYANDIN